MKPPLYIERDLIVSTIAGSTAHRAAEVAAFVDSQLQRVRSAGLSAATQREQAMRERIVAVAGALGLVPAYRGWTAAVARRIERDPAKYGFEQSPDRRTIRKARRFLLENSTTLASCIPQAADLPQTSSKAA